MTFLLIKNVYLDWIATYLLIERERDTPAEKKFIRIQKILFGTKNNLNLLDKLIERVLICNVFICFMILL